MITALFLTVIIGIVAVLSEILANEKLVSLEVARKLLHFVAGSAAAISVLLIDDYSVLISFGAFSVAVGVFLVRYGLLKSSRPESGKSWGIIFLPISFTVLVLFLYPLYKEIVFLSMLLLGVSDAAAAIFGSWLSQTYYKLTGDKKSVVGSITFFFSSFTLIILFFAGIIKMQMVPDIFFGLGDIILFALSSSLILTILEAISSKGFDNFTVPVFTAIMFYVFATTTDSNLIEQFTLGVFLALIIAVISIRFKFLTNNGSAATFILASFVFGLGGWKWALPIMTFFILSSLLSKYRQKENDKVDAYFEKSGTRDYMQVLANGGLGGILVIYNQINPGEINYYIYLASLAAVCADTWATEIGTLHKRPTYNILNFKKIEQGVSGGVSIVGTLGAASGALVIALSGLYWIDIYYIYYFGIIVGAGILGCFFDSFLGATIQAQAKCGICNKVTEKEVHCGEITSYHRGIKWLNNDAVNFLSGVASALIIIIIRIFN